jgi:Uncharacterised protein family (UPF0236)
LIWHTTYGSLVVEEDLWRRDRRGGRWRPFCQAAQVYARGCSRCLQRVLVDFGAEESFVRAAGRVREHYGVNVSVQRVRCQSLRHGAALSARPVRPPKQAARCVITQMDGSMIPVVVPAAGTADGRLGKALIWREVRLCMAREAESVTARYGATLGNVAMAGAAWAQTARSVGLGTQTQVHGVGDGADWIRDQFTEQFGRQGRYLVDFYHVSEYLAAAALSAGGGDPVRWRRRQEGRLLHNQVSGVLKTLAAHVEAETVAEAPVRKAVRYLSERRAHLDYAGARAQGLPIGSGEIESGHRHVIQQRLKLAGAWWRESNAEKMLGLRVARANNLWDEYWRDPITAQN